MRSESHGKGDSNPGSELKPDRRRIRHHIVGIAGSLLMPAGLYTAYILISNYHLDTQGTPAVDTILALACILAGQICLLGIPMSTLARITVAVAYLPLGWAGLMFYALLLVCSLGIDCL